MYVMSPCFQTVVYPASITDKHKAPRALIWACHKPPAAPAMQWFTNRCGGHISIQPDLFIGFFVSLLSLFVFVFVVQIADPVALCMNGYINMCWTLWDCMHKGLGYLTLADKI